MPHRRFRVLLREEFAAYDARRFRSDLLAGITVGAVALPLALAFGVASGASAASGLVTAIFAGVIIGLLSGASYQISGPTGAMTAVLIAVVQQHGLVGVWVAGALAGAMLLVIGALRLGRLIAFIPSPVMTGFTSGIAIVIAAGQLDPLFGNAVEPQSTLSILNRYLAGSATLDWHAALVGGAVVLMTLLWPKRLASWCPGSLAALIIASVLVFISRWPVPVIGDIPTSPLLAERLRLSDIHLSHIEALLLPAFSIAALGAIESLLCGAVGSRLSGKRLLANQELMAQGVGNIIIPFLGGVPATAAIARTSVAIRSGCETRVTSIVHALFLLLSMVALSPFMSHIPLSALAGILLVTAWRMNEWESIHFIFSRRFKTAICTFLITLIATVVLDLTQAILIGTAVSAIVFLSQSSQVSVKLREVDHDQLREKGIKTRGECSHTKVAFVTGPLFFAATGHIEEALRDLSQTHALILSLRGVPLIDTSGIQALAELEERLRRVGGALFLAGVNDSVGIMLERSGLTSRIGRERIFWAADQAIVAADKLPCRLCGGASFIRPEQRS